MMCSLTAAEVAVILAQQYPESGWSQALARLLPMPGRSTLRITIASVTACLLGITGGLTRMWCHRTLGRFFTWEITVRENHELVTDGPYSIVRHPSYAGSAMVTAGNIILLTTSGSYFTEAGLWNSVVGKTIAYSILGYLTWVGASLCWRTP